MQQPNGWIEWKGGDCPVPQGQAVDVRHRDGAVFLNQPALSPRSHRGRAEFIGAAKEWGHTGGVGDIIAYRLAKASS